MRDRVLLSTCVVVITALAWAYLIHLVQYDKAMAAMGMTMDHPWTSADVYLNFAMWTVMMAGMMSASALPMLLLFAGTRRGSVPLFSLGYFAVWTGFSALATLVQWALPHRSLDPRLAGVILLAAGIYQLTPWKSRCLTHCRSPLGFLMTNWRDGNLGALRMGAGHGLYCLGCCWALMCMLFAVGVMNLVWVAALAIFVLLEKVGPAGAMVGRVAGAAIAVRGLLLIAAIA